MGGGGATRGAVGAGGLTIRESERLPFDGRFRNPAIHQLRER